MSNISINTQIIIMNKNADEKSVFYIFICI